MLYCFATLCVRMHLKIWWKGQMTPLRWNITIHLGINFDEDDREDGFFSDVDFASSDKNGIDCPPKNCPSNLT